MNMLLVSIVFCSMWIVFPPSFKKLFLVIAVHHLLMYFLFLLGSTKATVSLRPLQSNMESVTPELLKFLCSSKFSENGVVTGLYCDKYCILTICMV